MKLLALAGVLVAFAGLGMSQNCQTKPYFPCKIQVSDTKVVAHNDDDVCTFTVPEPETVAIVCRGLHDAREALTLAFVAGQCRDGFFLAGDIIRWRFCRAADSTTKFTWDIVDGNLERSGILF